MKRDITAADRLSVLPNDLLYCSREVTQLQDYLPHVAVVSPHDRVMPILFHPL